jgi:ABC-type cobalamin transport system ATPase subunit
MAVLVLAAVILMVAGCGNVYLKGEALTAAETSTLDAYQAVQRGNADAATPGWEKAYLTENFKQWRFFVRSARKDLVWGPKLPDERGE